MKSLTNQLMVAAAAMVAVAGMASAQSMKAEVPFAFSVGGKTMPAGTYQVGTVRSNTGVPVFRVYNTDSKRPALVSAMSAHDSAKSDSDAKLVFRCDAGDCALSQIWTGTSAGAYDLHTPKSVRQEASLIAIPAIKAD